MPKLFTSPFGRLTALVLALALSVLGLQAANAGDTASTDRTAPRTVAHTKAGKVTSTIVGKTGNGRKVTGSFVPLKFSRHDGKVFVRGIVQGVVHEKNGGTTTFTKIRTLRVKSINGVPARTARADSAAALAVCDILHLDLAPLDLDLLGLQVHLSRVVLDIVAVSGAGNLLGNLLCAVTGLLDGGLNGLLGRLVLLLNQILSILRLG